MVKTYWEVGRLIVEDEQQGEKNASYGQYQLKTSQSNFNQSSAKVFMKEIKPIKIFRRYQRTGRQNLIHLKLLLKRPRQITIQ